MTISNRLGAVVDVSWSPVHKLAHNSPKFRKSEIYHGACYIRAIIKGHEHIQLNFNHCHAFNYLVKLSDEPCLWWQLELDQKHQQNGSYRCLNTNNMKILSPNFPKIVDLDKRSSKPMNCSVSGTHRYANGSNAICKHCHVYQNFSLFYLKKVANRSQMAEICNWSSAFDSCACVRCITWNLNPVLRVELKLNMRTNYLT